MIFPDAGSFDPQPLASYSVRSLNWGWVLSGFCALQSLQFSLLRWSLTQLPSAISFLFFLFPDVLTSAS